MRASAAVRNVANRSLKPSHAQSAPALARHFSSAFKTEYDAHVAERAAEGIVPLPLSAKWAADVVEMLKNPPAGEGEFALELLKYRVPPGVDDASYVKAGFLTAISKGEASSPLIDKAHAIEMLGTMLGGYNVAALVDALDVPELAPVAVKGLKETLLMFDAKFDVEEKMKAGNKHAEEVMKSWADGEWFCQNPMCRRSTSSVSSRSRVKPTLTTCRLHKMRGLGLIFLSTHWRCLRMSVMAFMIARTR